MLLAGEENVGFRTRTAAFHVFSLCLQHCLDKSLRARIQYACEICSLNYTLLEIDAISRDINFSCINRIYYIFKYVAVYKYKLYLRSHSNLYF